MNYYKKYINGLYSALDHCEVSDCSEPKLLLEQGVEKFSEVISGVLSNGGRQFFVGNGASAAFANHMALDWSKNGGVPSFSFSDSATLTALANDNGAESIFSDPLKWYAKEGDLLVTISSSGNSPNILAAIQVARKIGMKVVTLSGLKSDNKSRQLGDLNYYVPAKTYGMVECAHQVILHAVIDCFMGVEEWRRDGFQNMRKDEFSL